MIVMTRGRMGRPIVAGPTLAVALLLLLHGTARAQSSGGPSLPSWYITTTVTGQFTATQTDSTGKTTTNPQALQGRTSGGNTRGWNFTSGSSTAVSCSGSLSGTVTITAAWLNPDGSSGANPPSKLNLKITGQSACSWGPTGSGSAADGIGDPYVAASSSVGASSGTHTMQKNGASTVTVTLQISAAFVSQGNAGTVNGAVGGFISVGIDPRSVSLSRIGAHNETRDSSGNVIGDTLYSRNDVKDVTVIWPAGAFNTVPVEFDNWQNFAANISTGWSDNLSWTWSPNESQDTETSATWEQAYGTTYIHYLLDGSTFWQPSEDSPKADTLTYTLTDNTDGFSATATYTLTKHDPLEPINPQYKCYGTNWKNAGLTVYNPPSQAPAVGYVEASLGVTVGVTLEPDKGLGQMVLGWLGISADFSVTVTVNAGTQVSGPLPPGYMSTPQIGDNVIERYGTGATYDAGGYTGIGSYDTIAPYPPYYALQMSPPQKSSGPGNGP